VYTGGSAPAISRSADERSAAWGFAVAFWCALTPVALQSAAGQPHAHAPLFGTGEILLGTVPWSLLLGRVAACHRRRIVAWFSRLNPGWLLRIALASLAALFAITLVAAGVDTGDAPVMVIGFSLLTAGLLLVSHGDPARHRRRRRRRCRASSPWP
jgi:hypothetical protein